MGFANKMASGISGDILRAEDESGFKNFNHVSVSRKKGDETSKNSVFNYFWKIVELNIDVPEPSLLSEIDNWPLLFKISAKPNLLHVPLK